MAPRPGHTLARDAVIRRRARVVAMTEAGLYAREIAREIGLSLRQIQRHQRGHRLGLPAGKGGR